MNNKITLIILITFCLLGFYTVFSNHNEVEAATDGWVQSGTNWYYYENGVATTGWKLINNAWYYFDPSTTIMKTNWQQINEKWYYFHPNNGNMQTGWLDIGGKRYYLDPQYGSMLTGWAIINGKYYYFNSEGHMVTGWIQEKGEWYYLIPPNGEMAQDWYIIDGNYYFFKQSGAMANDAWITDRNGRVYYIKPGGVGYVEWATLQKGGKEYPMESGRRLVYDVYNSTYGGAGFRYYNDNGRMYLEFRGWAALFGHKPHNTSNQGTYIVVENTKTGEVRGYGTTQIAWSATEDLEYNKSKSTSTTIWNECAPGVINQNNEVCNMRYDDVGFLTYISLEELITDGTKPSEWKLFIVKRVDDMMVYDKLVLPFVMMPQPYKYGQIQLLSRVDANRLLMNSPNVIKRTGPMQNDATGAIYGYFNYLNDYYAYGVDETSTTIWFQVWDSQSSSYRWAPSVYWTFGGSQAVISYTPENTPPTHIAHSMTSTYRNGNDYWVQPNTNVNITLRQFDAESGNNSQYVRLLGNGVDASKGHSFVSSDGNNLIPYKEHSSLDIKSAMRQENTQYGQVQWTVTPKTHGHSYDVQYWYDDKAGNFIGYNSTGMKLRVDGVAPQHVSQQITGARYVSGNNYWLRPNDTVQIQMEQYDSDSGNNHQYIGLVGNGVEVRSTHYFNNGSTHLMNYVTNPNVSVNSANDNGSKRSVLWSVTAKTHGHIYDIQHAYQDNVNNLSNWTDSNLNLGVDGEAPTVQFRSQDDTRDLLSGTWNNVALDVLLKFADAHSGYNSSRYQWSLSVIPGTNWSNWQTSNYYTLNQPTNGKWYLHVESKDNVGNTRVSTAGPYTVNITTNSPPVAKFTYSPTVIYNDTNVLFTNQSSDIDGDPLTYRWELQEPNSTIWSQFSTLEHPSKILNKKGNWKIRLTVSDGKVSNSTEQVIAVQNRQPIAKFSYSPTTVYNDTYVSFTNNSSDPDKDTLTYKWEYLEPSGSSWVLFSTNKNPAMTLTKKGNWKVRLTVSDGVLSHSAEQVILVQNRQPNALFSYSPSTIYNDTSVSFTDNSSDPDKDTLTYKWEYLEPNSSSWTQFSIDRNPTKVLTKKGNWKIRLTVSDGALSHATEQVIPVLNRGPVANFSYNPTTVYNDTIIGFINKSSDMDNDPLAYKWEFLEPNSNTWFVFSTEQNPTMVLNKKGNWKIRLTVSDGALSHATEQIITVQNRPPVAQFSYSPTTVYNDTNITFIGKSTDPDKDTLTYKWETQEPNSTAWNQFSTDKAPTKVLNKKGNWKVRLTVSDGSLSHSTEQVITVQNRPPVADFSFSPTAIHTDTIVSFTNKSIDTDKDVLTYKWEYQRPNSTAWSIFSTVKNPSETFNIVGTWKIRLTVTDTSNASHSTTKDMEVLNYKPEVTVTHSPSTPYEGDPVKICVNVFDKDNHQMSVDIFVSKDNQSNQKVLNQTGVNSGSTLCYENVGIPGYYDIDVKVKDGHDEIIVETNFIVKPLSITGRVKHTSDWENKHLSLGHSLDYFYSGEKFLLEADTSDYPTVYVKSIYKGKQADLTLIERPILLSEVSSILYTGELYDPNFLVYPTSLKDGPGTFTFEVKYTNGVVKRTDVPIIIIVDGNVYDAMQFHRSF
ncbi:PKD domain-containing protein [Caldibacillus thermoamylovorans]